MGTSRSVLPALLAACLACASPQVESEVARAVAVESCLAGGRELLDAGRPAEAQLAFEEAASLDLGSLRTRVWVLRAWMDQGRGNDALDAIDDLAAAGHAGPELDYLYGMAFARRAQQKLSLGDIDGSMRMNFEDATGYLRSALAAEPVRFADAWPALAQSAWMSLDLELAREAAERGVAAYPANGDYHQLLGRIAFSQFVATRDEAGGWNAAAEEHWSTALDAFDRAIAAYGEVDREYEEYVLADAWMQRGNALLWKEDAGGASAAYTAAIALAPDTIEYAQARSLFAPDDFRRILEDGHARLSERAATRAGALLWWLGFARFLDGAHAEAEAALLASVEKEPAYTNAWLYVALSRDARGDRPGTVAALRSAWDADPTALVAEMQLDPEPGLAAVSRTIAWCEAEERFEDAVLLSRINAEAARTEPRYWNDLARFLRESARTLSDESAARARRAEALDAERRARLLESGGGTPTEQR